MSALGWAPYAAAALGGTCIATSFLFFDLFPLAWLAFAPVLWAVQQCRDRRDAIRIGLVAGMFTNVPAFHWLTYTINVFGGFPQIVAVFFYLVLSLYASLQFVLFAVSLRRVGSGALALAAPILWVTLEFLYPNLFPWRMAHTQFHVPELLQIGELTGPYGLSFTLVWFAAGAVELALAPRRWAPLVCAAISGCLIAGYGIWRLPQIDAAIAAAPKMRVALVQANISLEEKDDKSYFDVNLDRYAGLSEPIQDEIDLLVWPETVSQFWTPADTARLEGKSHPFPGLRTNLFFGGLAYTLTGPRSADEHNSAFLIEPDGRVIGRYDKRILMPFGEFIPFDQYFPWIRQLSPATAGFKAGTEAKVYTIPNNGMRLGTLICYEDLLSGMTRATTLAGAEALVTILNDAWYGESAAPHQHQALALWRTVETRRTLLRGSNTGVTSIIDAAGRVVDEGGLFTEEVIVGQVPRLNLLSPYVLFGDVYAWLVTALAAVWLFLPRPRDS